MTPQLKGYRKLRLQPTRPREFALDQRRFQRAAKVRRDRPGALRLRARWGVRHLELAAVGMPAIIFALVAAVAIAVAAWRWFR